MRSVHSRIHTNNGDTCRRAALSNHGVILQKNLPLKTRRLIDHIAEALREPSWR